MIMEEGSSETECSRTTPSDDEETEKKPSPVRPYVRSKTPRLRWTADLHRRFLQAVETLGGLERATPKLVLQFMNMRGLNIAHVKSHLQMYRSKQIDEHNYQGMSNHGLFLGGVGHQKMFNLRQIPLLPSFHQRHLSNFSQNYRSPINPNFCPRRKEEHLEKEFGLLDKQISSFGHVYFTSSNLVQHISRISNHSNLDGASLRFLREAGIKRKASNLELDLNLSLGSESRTDDVRQNNISSSDSVLIYKKLKEGFGNVKGRSTLDLTL